MEQVSKRFWNVGESKLETAIENYYSGVMFQKVFENQTASDHDFPVDGLRGGYGPEPAAITCMGLQLPLPAHEMGALRKTDYRILLAACFYAISGFRS